MKFFKNILFLISVIVFLSLVYIAQFNVFQTDDYINAAVAKHFSKIGHIKDFYFNVNYNLYNIGKEISGNHLRLYEQELNKRHEMIKNSKNSEVKLPKIKHLPTILYFEEMGEKNKPNYINKQLDSFYNKKEIYVEQY